MSRADWSPEDWEALGRVGLDLLFRLRVDVGDQPRSVARATDEARKQKEEAVAKLPPLRKDTPLVP
jgi:hypothetical protein